MSAGVAIEALPWDSRFFGFAVAKLSTDRLDDVSGRQAMAWCEEQSIRCLYFLAPPDDPATIAAAENHDFRLVDIRVELDRQLEASDGETHASIRRATDEDLPRLRTLASTEHQVTRFYQDPRFPRGLCDELYRTWITESLRGFADVVLVLDEGAGVKGYVTVRVDNAGARIGLIAVDPGARGRGYGGRLIQAAIQFGASHGARKAWVATQARNVDALRLYGRFGLRVSRVGLWYHRWFER